VIVVPFIWSPIRNLNLKKDKKIFRIIIEMIKNKKKDELQNLIKNIFIFNPNVLDQYNHRIKYIKVLFYIENFIE